MNFPTNLTAQQNAMEYAKSFHGKCHL